MAAEVISDTKHIARKDYYDDSTDYVQQYLSDVSRDTKLTFTELRAVANLKANGWRIKKGQLYFKQVGKFDGDLYTYRTLPVMAEICRRLQLWQEH